MSSATEPHPDLHEVLESALDACRNALADYRAGLIDDVELRRALFRWGLVQWPDSAWLLDLQAGRWCRYDGVELDGDALPLSSDGVARLRDVVDELSEAAR